MGGFFIKFIEGPFLDCANFHTQPNPPLTSLASPFSFEGNLDAGVGECEEGKILAEG